MSPAELIRELACREQTEAALRRSEEQYRTLFSAMSEGFALHEIICDAQGKPSDYRFLEINPAFSKLTGLTREQTVGQTVREVIPGIESHWIETYGQVALTGEPAHFQSFSGALARHYDVFAFSPSRGLFATLFVDVTDQRLAAEAIRRQQQLTDAVTDNILAHVAYLDRDFNFIYANATYAQGCGHKIEELIGRNHFALFPSEENETVFRRVRDTAEPYFVHAKPFEFADQPERGVTYWDWWLRPLKGEDGRTEGVVLSLVDVTVAERARQEVERLNRQLEAANSAKDQFLAMLSHELRTPLTPVLAAASVLERDARLPPDALTDLQMIRRNVELEARLIDDLLDLTRISRGKLQLDVRPVDLHRVIDHAIEICSADFDAKGLRFRRETCGHSCRRHGACDRCHHCGVMGDASRLQQVFWNLLKNASKFTPPGGQITLRCGPGSNGRAAIDVIDTGVGIEPELLSRIFDPFEQGAETARRLGGLGLGLAICRALVELHGGTIRATSAGRNQGATFRLELPTTTRPPVVEDRQVQQQQHEPAESSRSSADRPLSILLVEDHADTSRIMSRLLRAKGHAVQTAANVASAVKLCGEHRFELLISDLGLPDGTGLDLMRQVKAMYDLSGIALSGYGMEEDVRRSAEAGFLEHLTKPVDLARLHAAIRRVAAETQGQ